MQRILIRPAAGITRPSPPPLLGERVIEILRAGRKAVKGTTGGPDALTGQEIAQIRDRYRDGPSPGSPRTPDGDEQGRRHNAWVLAQRLQDKIDKVLHHLTDFPVPWTSNLAEQALRHVKVHLKISGCFRTLVITRAYCRIHSYLITIRLNAVPPMQAVRDALAGNAWTPLRPLTPA